MEESCPRPRGRLRMGGADGRTRHGHEVPRAARGFPPGRRAPPPTPAAGSVRAGAGGAAEARPVRPLPDRRVRGRDTLRAAGVAPALPRRADGLGLRAERLLDGVRSGLGAPSARVPVARPGAPSVPRRRGGPGRLRRPSPAAGRGLPGLPGGLRRPDRARPARVRTLRDPARARALHGSGRARHRRRRADRRPLARRARARPRRARGAGHGRAVGGRRVPLRSPARPDGHAPAHAGLDRVPCRARGVVVPAGGAMGNGAATPVGGRHRPPLPREGRGGEATRPLGPRAAPRHARVRRLDAGRARLRAQRGADRRSAAVDPRRTLAPRGLQRRAGPAGRAAGRPLCPAPRLPLQRLGPAAGLRSTGRLLPAVRRARRRRASRAELRAVRAAAGPGALRGRGPDRARRPGAARRRPGSRPSATRHGGHAARAG